MIDISYAPWTVEQVKKLEQNQNNGYIHPFTCPICSHENRYVEKEVFYDNEKHKFNDHVNLIPTINGWICKFDDYTQNWVYVFMLDEIVNPFLKI